MLHPRLVQRGGSISGLFRYLVNRYRQVLPFSVLSLHDCCRIVVIHLSCKVSWCESSQNSLFHESLATWLTAFSSFSVSALRPM